MAGAAIPIFVGGQTEWCGRVVLPAAVPDVAVVVVFAAALWLRRDHLLPVLRGRIAQLHPVEMVLAIAPLAVIATRPRSTR